MKKRLVLVVAVMALLMMACLPAMAQEADEGTMIDTRWSTFYLARGETMSVKWPDFVSYIDWRLKETDFDVTYEIDPEAGFWVNPDKTITVSEDAKLTTNFGYAIFVTYTPKVEGKGTKTTFKGMYASIFEPVTEITAPDEVTMYMDEEPTVEFYFGKNTIDYMVNDYSFNRSIIQTQKVNTSKKNTEILRLIPQGYGTTNLTVTAYNGVTATVSVHVVRTPSYVKFAKDSFECYEGDIVDIGTDFGNGSVSKQQRMTLWVDGQHYPEHIYHGYVDNFFASDLAHVKLGSGNHEITLTTVNGHTGMVRVNVFDKESSVRLAAAKETLRAGDEDSYIYAYDAQGTKLNVPLKVTMGMEFASMEGNRLVTTATGTVEVTAYNADGTTVSQTFTVIDNPSRIILNSYELTLDIGDTFDFEVGYDKGDLPYQCSVVFDDQEPEYGLFPVVLDGQRVTAQAPGTATFTVTAGKLTATCKITVKDSDKALRMDYPKEYLKVKDVYQLRVYDGTGKEYAAVFSVETALPGRGPGCQVTAGGLLTGTSSGEALITAELENGIRLVQKVKIAWVPKWMQAESILMRKNENKPLELYSDLGWFSTSNDDLIVEVTNKDLIDLTGGTVWGMGVGKATVTIKSKYADVQVTFTVEVLDRYSTEYIGTMSMHVPVGYTIPIQRFYDEQGNERIYYWKIVLDNPGTGNPNKSGFKLENNAITCTWPSASCEIVGARWDGSEKIKLTVRGYQLPESVYIVPEMLDVPLHGSATMELNWDQAGCEVDSVMWIIDNPDIAICEEYTTGRGQNTIQGKKLGMTMVLAAVTDELYALGMVRVYDPNHDASVRLPGDANVDGMVNILDALLVLQHDVGWEVEINLSNADVDGDGTATILDALKILQYDVGWNVELL